MGLLCFLIFLFNWDVYNTSREMKVYSEKGGSVLEPQVKNEIDISGDFKF